jgi:hypothetical protein
MREAIPMATILSTEEAKALIRLCETGRLYEVEAWIRAGRSLAVPAGTRKTPLGVAMSTGFHSLVYLLLRHEESQRSRDEALRHAVLFDRPAYAELAVAHGADVASVPFLDVLTTGDRALIASFLERGADPIADHPFARAFHRFRMKTTLGSYLDCRRIRPDLADRLQEQADMALRQFCQEGRPRWVALLLWAGANPRSRGPALDDAERADDPEFCTTALHEACGLDDSAILKRLGPTPADDLSGMLAQAAFAARAKVIQCLLDLGADPNDKPDGGSSALDACVQCLGWEDLDQVRYGRRPGYLTPARKVPKARGAIRLLVERGARWTPDPSTLNRTRRILYRLEPDVAAELVAMLLAREGGEASARELLRVPQMRKHVAPCAGRLARRGLTLDPRPRRAVVEAPPPPSQSLSAHVLAKYDRERLYEEVWAEPTRTVAARYGVSDAMLWKVCRQLKVPKPQRGYWAKKAAGRPTPERPKLKSQPSARENSS